MTLSKSISYLVMVVSFVLPLCVGCSGQLGSEVFNSNFLVDIGSKVGPEQQVTPSNDSLLLIRITNQTEYAVTINTEIVRNVSGVLDGPSFEFLGPSQSVGEVLEGCDTDEVLIVRIKPLLSETVSGVTIEVPDVYIWVNQFPLPPSSVPEPLIINDNYTAGDTIEYVVQSLPEDRDRFRVIALIYRSPI